MTTLKLTLVSSIIAGKKEYSTHNDLKTISLTIINESLGIHYSFYTAFTIEENQWDCSRQRPVNIYLKKYKALDHRLNALKIKVIRTIEEKRAQGNPVKNNSLFHEIEKICCSQVPEALPENTLLYFMKLYIDAKKGQITHSTYNRYIVFYKLISRFEGASLKNLGINQVGLEFIRDFTTFTEKEEYSESTVHRTIHFVKTILHYAEKKGIKTQVRLMEIKKEKQQRDIITLNEKELLKIESTPVPEELQQAKDWLLISCYTGQRVSDFMNFNKTQLIEINNNTCISFVQQKTGRKVTLPLHPVVLKIISRNAGFPEKMRLAEYNHHIKAIAQISGLNSEVYCYKRTGYRIKKTAQQKWEAISSHIGRRSFATNFYGKIPTSLLMEATGHTTETMFKRYVNTADEEKITRLGKYFEKMHQENQLDAQIA